MMIRYEIGKIEYNEQPPILLESLEDKQAALKIEQTVIKETVVSETVPEMIIRISLEIGLDPNLALALLKEENEGYDVFAISPENSNGSRDLGLFQLNSFYIYTDFVPRYWDFEEPFDVFDAENNTYVALSHLKYLMERFNHDILNAVRAYNGGENAVASNNLKPLTIKYSYRIMQRLGVDIE
jgi:hypothetical protein